MRKAFFLTFICAVALVTFTSAYTHAQDNAAQTGAIGTPPEATSDLPFVNKANQPVLQPLTPGAEPIDDSHALDAADGHAADGEHGKRKGLPQFDVSTFPRQIFWLIVTFVFLYVVYAKLTLPAIGGVLSMRADRIAGDITRAETLKAQVEHVKNEYEAAIAQAQSDAQAQIAEIQAEAKAEAEAADAAFKAKADEATAALEKKLDDGRKRIVGELNDLAAGLAVDITSRVAGMKVNASDARSIIDAQTGKAKAA